MNYIGRIDWKKNKGFDVITAITDEEIKSAGALGCQKYDECTVGSTTISYYRRLKMFGSVKV